jgi:4'-phosphopantetheinyl transferase
LSFGMSLRQNVWHNLSNPPKLTYGEIHVWRVFIDREISSYRASIKTLSPDEIQKADKFQFERDRWQFIVCRATLRKILGAYLRIQPSEICFSYNDFGKPTLNSVKDKKSYCFNISHSNGIVLIAVTNGQEVGIDLEYMKEEFATLKVAEQFCSQIELSALSSITDDLRVSAFYSFWTRKEAFAKAIGEGLSIPLKQIKLPIISGECESNLDRNFTHRFGKWSLVNLPPYGKFAAALVVKGEVKAIRHWNVGESN